MGAPAKWSPMHSCAFKLTVVDSAEHRQHYCPFKRHATKKTRPLLKHLCTHPLTITLSERATPAVAQHLPPLSNTRYRRHSLHTVHTLHKCRPNSPRAPPITAHFPSTRHHTHHTHQTPSSHYGTPSAIRTTMHAARSGLRLRHITCQART